jgi:predicted metal-dependent enzyme (double-stranded beta helix superfamily)
VRFPDLVSLLRTLDLQDDGALGSRRPPRDNVRTVQHRLTAWLADDDFYLDCVDLELLAVLRRTADTPQPPFYRDDDRGFQLRMFYWWPGRIASPHEHTAWTVTAVFYNALEVTTYDWDVALRERRLQPKSQFAAAQGAAGHIFERCIHSPANPTRQVATSIHIFNASDEPRIEREVGPIVGMAPPGSRFERGPDEDVRIEAVRQRHLRVLARMAAQFPTKRALRTLQAITLAGDTLTQTIVERLHRSIRAIAV